MLKMKKTLRALALALALSLLLPFSAFAATGMGEQIDYLLMGDSIAEGFGVRNPEEASYGAIVAATNGYAYHNIARFARNTTRQLQQLEQDPYARAQVAEAEIISLSIGGNDYFAEPSVVLVAAGLVFNIPTSEYKRLTAQMIDNFAKIIDEIRALNPDATLLVQTLYSSWFGLLGLGYRRGTNTVNDMIFAYLEAHPGAFEIVDVDGAITGHKELVALDTIHPNAAGNVVIARVILEKLKALGLGENTEPVVPAQGIEYNYFVDEYGKFFGPVITALVRFFTGNAF